MQVAPTIAVNSSINITAAPTGDMLAPPLSFSFMLHSCRSLMRTTVEAGAGIWTRPVFGPFVTIKVWMLRKSHRTKLLRYTWNLNWDPNTGLPKVGYRLLFRKPLRFAFCLAGWKSKLEPFPNKRTYLLDQFVLVLKLWPIEILGSKYRPSFLRLLKEGVDWFGFRNPPWQVG